MATVPTIGNRKTPEAYEQAILVTEGFLLGAAQARRIVTYAEIQQVIRQATGHRMDGRLMGRFLGDLVHRTFAKYGLVLSSLVVNSATLAPGSGFKPLAEELGLAKSGDDEAEVVHRLRAKVWHHFAD